MIPTGKQGYKAALFILLIFFFVLLMVPGLSLAEDAITIETPPQVWIGIHEFELVIKVNDPVIREKATLIDVMGSAYGKAFDCETENICIDSSKLQIAERGANQKYRFVKYSGEKEIRVPVKLKTSSDTFTFDVEFLGESNKNIEGMSGRWTDSKGFWAYSVAKASKKVPAFMQLGYFQNTPAVMDCPSVEKRSEDNYICTFEGSWYKTLALYSGFVGSWIDLKKDYPGLAQGWESFNKNNPPNNDMESVVYTMVSPNPLFDKVIYSYKFDRKFFGSDGVTYNQYRFNGWASYLKPNFQGGSVIFSIEERNRPKTESELDSYAKSVISDIVKEIGLKPRPNAHQVETKITLGPWYNYAGSGSPGEVQQEEPEKEEEPDADKPTEPKKIASKKYTISADKILTPSIWNHGRRIKDANGVDEATFYADIMIDAAAFDDKGNKIMPTPPDSEMFKGVSVVYKLREQNSQLGLLMDSGYASQKKLPVSTSQAEMTVQSKGPRIYKGPYKPFEYMDVYLTDSSGNAISNKLIFRVAIKDAAPSIKLKRPVIQVQDGDKRPFQFIVEDPNGAGKLATCTVTIPTDDTARLQLPYPQISLETTGQMAGTLKSLKCPVGEWISIDFFAPNLGNFDLAGEITKLSMLEMQYEGTAKPLANDVVGGLMQEMWADRLTKQIEGSEQLKRLFGLQGDNTPKNIWDNMNRLKEAKEAMDTAGEWKTNADRMLFIGTLKQTGKDLKESYGTAAVSDRKTWSEAFSDKAIFGINVAQTVVGAVSMAPKKIPVIGGLAEKATAKFSTAFNLMTNTWKTNLQWWSKMEKIDRAEEKLMPFPVIITVEDEDGFDDADIQIVTVAYNWV